MQISMQLNYTGDYRQAADTVVEYEKAGLDLVWIAGPEDEIDACCLDHDLPPRVVGHLIRADAGFAPPPTVAAAQPACPRPGRELPNR